MTFDDDFDLSPRTSKRQAARSTPRKTATSNGGKGKKKTKPFGSKLARFARYAAMAMSAMLVFGIVANALLAQKGQHPAPLFGKAIVLGNAKPAVPPSRAATPPRVVKAEASGPDQTQSVSDTPVESIASTREARQPVAVARARSTDRMEADDPIARFLAGGTLAPAQAKRVRHHTVAAAQKGVTR